MAEVMAETEGGLECAVCLQSAVYPVQLPCSHVFCFLCVKGFTTQSKRCAMCRREVPEDYIQNPDLLPKVNLHAVTEQAFEDEGGCWQWMYEGRNGWWLYDERTSQEIEKSFKKSDLRCELLIAGFLYIIDFEHMLQYRRNDPSRRRKIKRDLATAPKKGVAGLRMEAHKGDQEEAQQETQEVEQEDLTAALDTLHINSEREGTDRDHEQP